MSLDITGYLAGHIGYTDLVRGVTEAQLLSSIDAFFDAIPTAMSDITDAQVTFVARDPQSREPGEVGWTLSHVMTHVTARLEETSALAAMLARGVHVEEPLYYETPWETIQTVHQLQGRVIESRRMCHGFLATWPDEPHLDVTVVRARVAELGPLNAIGVAVIGIVHGYRHVDQIHEIVRQARQTP